MKRLLYLATLVVVVTLAFAPAALAQQETDLSCDTYPPQPGCEEGDDTAYDPGAPFKKVLEQAPINKIECMSGVNETARAGGKAVAPSPLTTFISSIPLIGPPVAGVIDGVSSIIGLITFKETLTEAENNPACRLLP